MKDTMKKQTKRTMQGLNLSSYANTQQTFSALITMQATESTIELDMMAVRDGAVKRAFLADKVLLRITQSRRERKSIASVCQDGVYDARKEG